MRIRKLCEKDVPLILEWMKDPQVNRFFRFDPENVSTETIQSFVDTSQDDAENIHLACTDDDDTYLGTVSLKHINPIDKNGEYAISFRRCAQGTGAASYATKKIIRIAFEERGLERIYLNVLSDNERAIRFYEKHGFKYEGEFRKHICIRGEQKDLKWYGLLKEDVL